MLLGFALFVIGIALIFFFAQEIGHVLKKISKIPGLTLCVLLAFGSWVVSSNSFFLIFILHRMQRGLSKISEGLLVLLPGPFSTVSWTKAVILCVWTILAFYLYPLVLRWKNRGTKKAIHPFLFCFIWTFLAILLLMM